MLPRPKPKHKAAIKQHNNKPPITEPTTIPAIAPFDNEDELDDSGSTTSWLVEEDDESWLGCAELDTTGEADDDDGVVAGDDDDGATTGDDVTEAVDDEARGDDVAAADELGAAVELGATVELAAVELAAAEELTTDEERADEVAAGEEVAGVTVEDEDTEGAPVDDDEDDGGKRGLTKVYRNVRPGKNKPRVARVWELMITVLAPPVPCKPIPIDCEYELTAQYCTSMVSELS